MARDASSDGANTRKPWERLPAEACEQPMNLIQLRAFARSALDPPASDGELETLRRWLVPRPAYAPKATLVLAFIRALRDGESAHRAGERAVTAQGVRDADEAGAPVIDAAAFGDWPRK